MVSILDSPVTGLSAQGVVTVTESATLVAAARHMAAQRVGAVVVVRGARPVGMLSERDITERIGAGANPTTDTAANAMTEPLVVACCGATVRALLTQMATQGLRHLPLVDADGHLVSLVSLSELVRRLVDDERGLGCQAATSDGASRWFG